MTYKRPSFRPHGSYGPPKKVSPGARGVVADICRVLHVAGCPPAVRKEWTPPTEYKYIAKFMSDEEAEYFTARCESWFEAHPPVVAEKPEVTVLDHTPLMELHEKYPGKVPPVRETLAAMSAAGYSQERLVKTQRWHQKMFQTSAERQKQLDAIFAKYPSANKNARASRPKKIIRAVKKKIVVEE
jgi:hypothetical protein